MAETATEPSAVKGMVAGFAAGERAMAEAARAAAAQIALDNRADWMTEAKRKAVYAALSAPFPEQCIERTKGEKTKKGYDTTGIAYQWVVNRFNEVLGPGSFRCHQATTVRAFDRNGRPTFEAICDLTIELGFYERGEWYAWAEAWAPGGHISNAEADARKGAFTNAFKKAAAFFGVGRQAYEGTLDDDNRPAEESEEPRRETYRKPEVRTEPKETKATTTPDQEAAYQEALAVLAGEFKTRGDLTKAWGARGPMLKPRLHPRHAAMIKTELDAQAKRLPKEAAK
jgi:Rad52/22 family double-strand break repair protein